MPLIRLWFYKPSPDESGWLNNVIATLDPPYCHCELQFEDEVSCCIYMGTQVQLKKRTFDEKFYDEVKIACNPMQYQMMYDKAKIFEFSNLSFSTVCMTKSMMWIPFDQAENTTFCSKLCADILQLSNIVPASYNTSKITPSKLHRITNTQVENKTIHVSQRSDPIGFK